MGDIITQDCAYTINVILSMVKLVEDEFQLSGFVMPVRDMEATMFFIASCLGGFRGYETV